MVAVVRHFWEIMDERARALGLMEAILSRVGVDHVLIGGLAAGYHGKERATVDVDMLVHRKQLRRIAKEVQAHGYKVLATPDMIRVYPTGGDPVRDSIADLVGAESNPVLQAAFKASKMATVLGCRLKIVTRGAFVALKFHAAMSLTRDLGDKYQDVADIDRVLKREFTKADEREARTIASLAYPGAGNDFHKMIDDLRHGRPVAL
jgi:hypothetical protein